ncbi:MAG: CocE/NonD family hydrolase [Betaproteobacteria bacterium]
MSTHHSEIVGDMRIDWDVPVTMSDGTVLRCDVFRPNDNGRHPVLLGATPYGKWLSFQDPVWGGQWKMLSKHEPEILKLSSNRFQNYEFPDPERFVPDGYVLVRVDVRGTGRSPGVMDLLSIRETQDFYECIEWAGVQDWSSGRVGLSGVSYLAMNQWQVAALQPPHLAAICVWEGCSDFYREFTRHAGILSLFGDLWFEKYVLPVQHGLGERGWRSHIVDDWVSGSTTADAATLAATMRDWRADVREYRLASDKFWTDRLPDFSRITVPLLSSGNWGGQGLHLRGNVEGWLRAKSPQKWLDFHCFEHWTEFYTQPGIALQKRFFAHFLKGEDNGWAAEPRVQMLVRNPTRPVTALATLKDKDWPLTGTDWTKLYLDPARAALDSRPPVAKTPVQYNTMGDGVSFLTAPLTQDTYIIGPSAAYLRASSTTEDADLFLILRLFTPDMKEVTYSGSNDPHTPMSHGWLRASSRKLDAAHSLPYRPYHAHDEVQKLEPGKAYDLAIEIFPTCFVAPAGYRIGLTIRGKDYEYPGDLSGSAGQIGQPSTGVGPFRHIDAKDRPAAVFDNQVTLHFDGAEHPYLLLPVVPPHD